jgi:acetolactate synthase-1/2/3 large subunit
MNGAQSLFKALVDAGITTCFANPGTSEMQLVYEIGMTDKVRPILCLQEDVVTGAADGFARMTGAPAFTLLHVGSGFANGIAMLHNAGRANTPIVNVVGANASYHQPNYPEHELIGGRITDLARAVSHWSREARSASNLGELGAEAAGAAPPPPREEGAPSPPRREPYRRAGIDRSIASIADQKELAQDRSDGAPVCFARVFGGEHQEDLRLARIGIL